MNRYKSVGLAAQLGANIITADAEGKQIMHVFYIQSIQLAAVASGAAATGQFNVNVDGDFMIRQLTCQADSNNVILAPPFLGKVQITDTASNQNLFDQSQPIANLFGDGRLPFILPVPRRIRGGGTVILNLTNGVSANPVNFNFSFIGEKLLPLN